VRDNSFGHFVLNPFVFLVARGNGTEFESVSPLGAVCHLFFFSDEESRASAEEAVSVKRNPRAALLYII